MEGEQGDGKNLQDYLGRKGSDGGRGFGSSWVRLWWWVWFERVGSRFRRCPSGVSGGTLCFKKTIVFGRTLLGFESSWVIVW